jgi:glycosyltransferase involved in cell wall biosynthesis
LSIEGVNVTYVSLRGNKIIRGIRFFLRALMKSSMFRGIILINYFDNCYYLRRILPWKKMILDIRTLSVKEDDKQRNLSDIKLKKACSYFDFITIISEGLREKLELKYENSAILPLGSDIISTINKKFESLNLLYVGVLTNRNIFQTVKGLSIFCLDNPHIENITYDIIGDGDEYEEIELLVKSLNLSDKVILHGRIPHFELKPYFDRCNIGISYVPLTEYYDFQPVTKSYEYILSGIFCIATSTYCNRQIISSDNGLLIEDNPDAIAEALNQIYKQRDGINSNTIRNTLLQNTWDNIVSNHLIPILKNI